MSFYLFKLIKILLKYNHFIFKFIMEINTLIFISFIYAVIQVTTTHLSIELILLKNNKNKIFRILALLLNKTLI